MIWIVGVHASEEAKVISVSVKVRKEFRDPEATLSMLPELPWRRHETGAAKISILSDLPVIPLEVGFVVKGVNVRGGPLHRDHDDPFGSGGEVCGLGANVVNHPGCFGLCLLVSQGGESEIAKPI